MRLIRIWVFHYFIWNRYGCCLNWCRQAYLTPIIWLLHMTCIIFCFLLTFGVSTFPLPNKSIQTLSSKLVRIKGSRDGVMVTVSPTYVSWVWFPDPASHVSWVCYWFSTLLREVFLQILQFSPLLKKTTFPNSNSTLECTGISELPGSSCDLLSTTWVNKLHIYIIYWHIKRQVCNRLSPFWSGK